jgi:IS5 family transposase
MVGLLLLKPITGLSDEGVCERWVHDPYIQYFTGEAFFQHGFPHERSGLTHWRGRLGDRLELLLAKSLRVATGASKAKDLERVTVDTTVQPKNVTHPTDAKLMHKAIVMLGELARKHGVELRQSYVRVAKQAAIMAGRYAHAKQWKRQRRQLKFLRIRLGRLIRDIRRKIEDEADLKKVFAEPLSRASQIRSQQQRRRGWKLYSLCTRPRSSASPRARPTSPTSSASRSRSPPPTPAPPAASSCSTPRPFMAGPMTAIPLGP